MKDKLTELLGVVIVGWAISCVQTNKGTMVFVPRFALSLCCKKQC